LLAVVEVHSVRKAELGDRLPKAFLDNDGIQSRVKLGMQDVAVASSRNATIHLFEFTIAANGQKRTIFDIRMPKAVPVSALEPACRRTG
jgi:hypothetical protein